EGVRGRGGRRRCVPEVSVGSQARAGDRGAGRGAWGPAGAGGRGGGGGRGAVVASAPRAEGRRRRARRTTWPASRAPGGFDMTTVSCNASSATGNRRCDGSRCW